jgi:sugar phosphate isomerase/epimerase
MKLCMMSYTMARGEWGQTHDVEALCRLTRELGLDAVDWVTTYGEEPRAIRRAMDDYGLTTACYTFMAALNSPDAAARREALEQVRAGLEVAAVLGADKVMLPLGGVAGVPREETRRRALEGLAEAVRLGGEAGIAVTIEHFPGAASPFVLAADMEEAVREVPGLRITFDNGNVLTGGEAPAETYRRTAAQTIHAHFKDYEVAEEGLEGLDGRRYRGALVGEGLVDAPSCLRAMRECGYQGYIDFEYEGMEYTPEEATRKGVRLLEAMMEEVGV